MFCSRSSIFKRKSTLSTLSALRFFESVSTTNKVRFRFPAIVFKVDKNSFLCNLKKQNIVDKRCN